MSSEPKDLVLEHLRAIRGILDAHSQALGDLKDGQILIRHDILALAGHSTHQAERIAALEAKMETVFRRLDLDEQRSRES